MKKNSNVLCVNCKAVIMATESKVEEVVEMIVEVEPVVVAPQLNGVEKPVANLFDLEVESAIAMLEYTSEQYTEAKKTLKGLKKQLNKRMKGHVVLHYQKHDNAC